ncbi:hypothetical protein P7L78_02345 (plasmid) [Tistrella bauzanensis]|jgi:hypothetical protein|uniref:DUF2474 domain-containing protein n=1 Tax=Tistrella TaxID=171436 RepID=UPI0031F62F7A
MADRKTRHVPHARQWPRARQWPSARQWIWFVGLWAAGVGVTMAVGLVIKAWLA